jgi:hypothetical protein
MTEHVVNVSGGKIHLKSFHEEDGRVFPFCGVSMTSLYVRTKNPITCGTCLRTLERSGKPHEHDFNTYVGYWSPPGSNDQYSILYACSCGDTVVLKSGD